MTMIEMRDIMRKYEMKSPITNNDLTDPMEFNLMFATQIGPTGLIKGYLNPFYFSCDHFTLIFCVFNKDFCDQRQLKVFL